MPNLENGSGHDAEVNAEERPGLEDLLRGIPDKPTEQDIENLVPRVAEEIRKTHVIISEEAGYGELTDDNVKAMGNDMRNLYRAACYGCLSENQLKLTSVSEENKQIISGTINLNGERFGEEAKAEIYAEILKRNGLL